VVALALSTVKAVCPSFGATEAAGEETTGASGFAGTVTGAAKAIWVDALGSARVGGGDTIFDAPASGAFSMAPGSGVSEEVLSTT